MNSYYTGEYSVVKPNDISEKLGSSLLAFDYIDLCGFGVT
jgi:hypothetical protein